MSKKIGFLTFGRDDFAYGMALVLSSCSGEPYRITPKTARLVDQILFSCFWWEHIYLVADFLRKSNIDLKRKDRPEIIIGGFNTFNPVPFADYCDYVFVGDGDGFGTLGDAEISKHKYTLESKSVLFRRAPITPFIHETNNIARIELSRSCKFKCKFCAVSKLKTYSELTPAEVDKLLKQTRMKRVSLFAPEPSLHSSNDEIDRLCRYHGKTRIESDIRLDSIGEKGNAVHRVGLEGISYKLRKSVGKGYKHDWVVNKIDECIKNGHRGIFFYIILDLPGEDEGDWQEFKTLLEDIGKLENAKDFVIKPSPSVFMPSPHTAMQYNKINWERDYKNIWMKFFRPHQGYKGWDVMIAERARVFSPAMRILSMLSTRAGAEFYDIEKELSNKKIIQISSGRPKCNSLDKLLKCLEHYGGVDKYCGEYRPEGAPWNVVKLA